MSSSRPPSLSLDTAARRRRLAEAVLLGAMLLGALYLRTFPLTFSHFWDETVYLQHAKIFAEGRDNYSELYCRPPLLSLCYAAGFRLWNNIYVTNVVQGLLTTLLVLFGYLYSRAVHGRATGLVCAAAFAFSPYIVELSHQLLSGLPSMSFMMASLYLLTRKGDLAWFLAGVCVALAVLTRFTALYLGLYFVLHALLFRPPLAIWLRRWLLCAAGAFLGMLPYFVWSQLRFGHPLYVIMTARHIVGFSSGREPVVLYVHAIGEIFPVLVLIGLGVAIVRAGWQTAAAVRARGTDSWLQRVDGLGDRLKHDWLLILWGAAFLAYMCTLPHKETRYLLPVAVAVVPLAAAGLVGLAERVAAAGRGPGVAFAGVLLAVALIECRPALERFRWWWEDDSVWPVVELALYLGKTAGPGDTIYAVNEYPVLAFYSGVHTESLLEEQDSFAERWREDMPDPGFFVSFERDAGMGYQPDRAFLDRQPEFVPVRRFDNAVVYRYTPAP